METKSDGDPMVSALLEDENEYHCPKCGGIAIGIRFEEDGAEIARCKKGNSWKASDGYDELAPIEDENIKLADVEYFVARCEMALDLPNEIRRYTKR